MSTLSKFFVVINFVMALIFTIASITLYAKKVDWVENVKLSEEKKIELEIELDAVETELTALKESSSAEIERWKGQSQTFETKSNDLQDQVATLRKEKERLLANMDSIKDNIASLKSTLEEQAEENQKLNATNGKLKDQLDQAKLSSQFASRQAIEVVAELKEAEAELLQLSKKNHELVNQVMEQDILLEEARKRGMDFTTLASQSAIPVSGHVLQVEDAVGLVILNVGEKNKVKKGMELVISRGEKYIGKVRVRSTYEDMCSAVILAPLTKEPIQAGDLAQTL